MIALLLVTICSVATALSIGSTFAVTSRRRACAAALPATPPAISVLKPLCGADEALESNLETFFAQDYPRFELVFGLERAEDPAHAVVRRLIARHPLVRARVIVHGRVGLNPKIANLRGMLVAGSHDVLVISDSNVAAPPDYLAGMMSRFLEEGVGLVTSLFAGAGERSLGARLEGLHLGGPIAGSVAASEAIGGQAVCVGKSMMFRRAVFESLGGMESVATVLAEDYVMGRMFTEAGYDVRVAPGVIQNVTVRTSVRSFLARQARWALLRWRVKPLLYPLEPLAMNPSAVALAALALGAGAWVIAWAIAATLVRDGAQWLRLRGARGIAWTLLGAPKDLLLVGAWAAAPFMRSVKWRGKKLRVSAGTRVYARDIC